MASCVRLSIFSILFVLSVFGFFDTILCSYEDYNCTYPNDCTYTRNYPICLENKCRQCVPEHELKDCQCPPGDYCISDKLDPYFGYCRSKYSEKIVGRPCNEQLRGNWRNIIQGANDSAFCGLITFNNDLTPRALEWEGVCAKGICQECANVPITSIPFSICSDGRSCHVNGRLTISTVGILSWNYLPYEPFQYTFIACVTFMTLASLFIFIGSIYLVLWRKRKTEKLD